MREILSTDSVSRNDRLDYWNTLVSRVFWPLRVGMSRRQDYRASLNRDVCGALELATVTAQAQLVRRTAEQAASSGADRLLLGLQLTGPGLVNQDGRECSLEPGQATVLDPARPYTMDFADSFSLAVFALPRTLVRSVFSDTQRVTARLLKPGSAVAATALSYLSCVATVSIQHGLDDAALANGALGIAATLLREVRGDESSSALHDETHERAVAFIELHLNEPDLDPATVAGACHVSLRQLYRVFDTNGHSVAKTIRERRLMRARALLESMPPNTPASWVGAKVGFTSAEQFTRAFREAYGVPPATWRAARWRGEQIS